MMRILSTRSLLQTALLLSISEICSGAAAIYESTAWMQVSWDAVDASDTLSADQVYALENEASVYFASIVDDNVDQVLSMQVSVTDETPRMSGRVLLDAVVTSVYLDERFPIQLDTVLLQNMNEADLKEAFAGVLGDSTAEALALDFSLRPYEDTLVLESVYIADGRTRADKGLITAVVILTVMVLLVSSVLLYVTGGWNVCLMKINNFLFEEVEEDDYAIEKRATFQVQSYDEDDDNRSSTRSEAPSVESGMTANPTAGPGILQTPIRELQDEPLTPMTETPTGLPLGIQSIRKMPPPDSPDVDGGLSHMILQRVMGTNKNESKSKVLQQP
ncbi:predicted protein [Phaeodactylum tricornutum CCAP 1055/1]|uniref:SEA domain-containing protein n=2 Tax=Phaeodactylum tricornutum TaxID=2850 RepID=B7FSL3_PHATC|nr:predicted protein [Phaeodactylum tricornutum CCAP 1055/1]EEC50816.1 predicted protein [Phaeodactylum tricornutum CCAP 1055/1]|eukprot:XP_002178002.1 predicted protein [Phaeodactylum tricornutum CCAP 1055/1]